MGWGGLFLGGVSWLDHACGVLRCLDRHVPKPRVVRAVAIQALGALLSCGGQLHGAVDLAQITLSRREID